MNILHLVLQGAATTPFHSPANVAKAQHFSMLVKVNYENQRKLTAEISKSTEKLMNLQKSG